MDELVRDWTAQLLDAGNAVALVTGLVSLLLVVGRRSWRLLRNAVTIAHEGGHALVALLSGRKLNGIRLHSDTSGLTVSTGKSTGPGMVLTLFAGYPAVSLLGLGGAWLVTAGRTQLLLWVCVGLLAAMLLAVRNAYGTQVDSFAAAVDAGAAPELAGLRCVFIRAPQLTALGPGVEVLTRVDGRPVLVREGNVLAATFHPELTDDARIHELLLRS